MTRKATLTGWQRLTVAVVFVGVFLFWSANWFALPLIGLDDLADQGQFGEKFGAVSALFSALAFAGVIVTVFLQKEELRLQREELEQTRAEIRGQREQLEAQNRTLRVQRFEDTYFNMLSLLGEQIKGMRVAVRSSDPDLVGRACFAELFNRFQIARRTRAAQQGGAPISEIVEQAYKDCHLDSYIGYYYRTLSHIIRFVDHNAIKGLDFYMGVLRAQLSTFELALLMYICLMKSGSELKLLIEKYSFFRNWTPPGGLGLGQCRSEFAPSAFGEDEACT